MAFNNAHSFTIHKATLSSPHHYHHYYDGSGTSKSDPMKILHDARAVEATHTSRTAEYAPKCKPGSRALVIRDIMGWINAEGRGRDGEPETSILWFHGPAGGGKTCVMREIAVQCQRARLLAATYFFSTRVRGLGNEKPFVATIAHQLAGKSPELKAEILRAVSEDPDMFHSSGLHSQMQKVIIEPLLSTSGSIPDDGSGGRARVIVVDGFDECKDPQERTHLLTIFFELMRPITRNTRLLVVVASRPELDIRQTFNRQRFAAITHVIRLQDYEGASDIRDYFCDEFSRIRETHPARGVIPESWPAEDIIDILVDKSSGCFIYPATVIKHIDNPRRNPVGLLDEVMALIKPLARVNPLAELDALYNHILRPPDTDMALVTRILNCIMVLHQTPSPPDPTGPFLSVIYTPAFIDLFLLLPRGEVAMAMCELHSVIRIPSAEEDEAVNFFHKTLADFLISPERSGDLHCPLYRTHLDFSSSCVYHIQSTVRRSDITTRHVLQYAHWNWGGHLARAFQESPKEARHMLPLSIEKFDPVQSWKYQVNQIQAPLIFDEREKIHSMICEQSGNCVELCVKAIQTERWSKEFETFYAQSVQEDVVNRKAWVTRRTIPDGAEVDIPVPTQVFRERFATFVKMLEGRAKKSKSSSALADPTQGKSSSSSQAPPPQVSPGKHIPSLIRRITEASPPVTSESAVAVHWETPFDLFVESQNP